MAKSNTKHRVCSRESSVSSLLASCSLSGSHSSNSDGSFQHKDKLYSSASQALQAYIDDFDLSRMCPGVTTGKMNICKCPANVPEFSSYVYKPNNGIFFSSPPLHRFERPVVVFENYMLLSLFFCGKNDFYNVEVWICFLKDSVIIRFSGIFS